MLERSRALQGIPAMSLELAHKEEASSGVHTPSESTGSTTPLVGCSGGLGSW
jgi:hypothetical protein